MQKRTAILLVLLITALMVQAQQKPNVPEADKNSYDLYLQGNWKGLIQYADQVRQQGIDFFYLQARTGIAYYNLKHYRTASEWFLKAWEADKSFEWLQEYLYYSLLFGGRAYEAYKVAGEFSPATQEKIGFEAKKLTGIGLEAGYSFNPGHEDLMNAPHGEHAGAGGNYGEAYYLKNYNFQTLDLSHRIAPAININHSLTHIGINRTQRIDWGSKNIFEVKSKQYQYFVSPNLVLGKRWHVSPSLSLIWGDFSYSSGGISGNKPFFSNATESFRDLVFSFSTWTHLGIFSPGAEFNYGNINNEGFNQYSLWLTLYPFSNLNFYFTPRVYFKSSKEFDFSYNTFGLSGGVQAGPVHLYMQYLNGEMENFIEPAGYVVSNFPGTSEQKFSGSIYFPTGNRYQFVLRYITQDVTEMYQVYNNRVPGNILNYSYTKHTVTAGISWSF